MDIMNICPEDQQGEYFGVGGTGEPDVVVVEPIVKLKPDKRGPVERGGCLGGDSIHMPIGPVKQGECFGVGGTGDVVVVEPVEASEA